MHLWFILQLIFFELMVGGPKCFAVETHSQSQCALCMQGGSFGQPGSYFDVNLGLLGADVFSKNL